MKRLLLAATAASAFASAASAEVVLFGNARLGVGYGIQNNGQPWLEAKRSTVVERGGEEAVVDTLLGSTDDLRAISRVRFGVVMSGETDSGIAFGATIRADNAGAGNGGGQGQRAGAVFVTGAWGALTYGDTDGGDRKRVGDPIGNVSVTGLGDYNQIPFLSNGGGSDNDQLEFLANPDDRPTVRYDYDWGGLGLSVSTDRDLRSVAAGLGYDHEFEGGSLSLGIGYYDFNAFDGDIPYYGEVAVPDGDEWSAAARLVFGGFRAGIGFSSIRAGNLGEMDTLGGGVGYAVGPWTAMAYYTKVISGDKTFGEAYDGSDSFGGSLAYDLGGGATVNFGLVRSFEADAVGAPEDDQYAPAAEAITMADFGIRLEF